MAQDSTTWAEGAPVNGIADVLLASLAQGRAVSATFPVVYDEIWMNASGGGVELPIDSALRDAVLARLALLAHLDLATEGVQTGRFRAAVGDALAVDFVFTLRPTDRGLTGDLQCIRPQPSLPANNLPNQLPRDALVGPYRVRRTIGKGGMGVVYEVEHEALQRRFAMKVVRRSVLAEHPEATTRFLSEARAAAAVRHPGIINVSDFGNLSDGRPYLIMDHIEGQTLREFAAGKSLSPIRALEIARSIAEALAAAHAAGVVHRDLTPANVFLPHGQPERVVLVDFGAAVRIHDEKTTDARGQIIGTPCYLAPEQVTGGPPDPRTDLYQLGILLFELLTGRVPFDADTVSQLFLQHLHKQPPPVRSDLFDLPQAVERLVHRMLAKSLDARPQSATELVACITDVSEQLCRSGWRKWLPR